MRAVPRRLRALTLEEERIEEEMRVVVVGGLGSETTRGSIKGLGINLRRILVLGLGF